MDEMSMDNETKEALRLNFDNVANERACWFYVAGNLGFSARILEQYFVLDMTKEPDHERIVQSGKVTASMLMLRGCRLECMLKALYVGRGNKLGLDGQYVSPGGKPHDLLSLSRKAAVSTTAAEDALLEYLSLYIVQGRYPIGKRAPDTFRVMADGSRRSTVWGEEDERAYKHLDQRLSAQVSRMIRERSAVQSDGL